MKRALVGGLFLAAAIGMGAAAAQPGRGHDAPSAARQQAHQSLSAVIKREIRAGGPFFTPDEQKVIAAKCGYRVGEWDGYDANMSDGVFICTNGRRIDDPEMRAVIAAAGPRIRQRVNMVMAQADVRAAIDRVAAVATDEALRRVRERLNR